MNYKTNITTTTEEKRNQIKGRLDDFATFVWRGENAFDICGAFIIADKHGDLKFYNGPSFSNEYTKPQFSSSSGNLTGISFNRQQIQFKIGAYWFSIEEWQNFIEWVNAYEVNYLTFSHSPKYSYLVKLAKIADSPRYIVGYENEKPRYYTEIDLTWDLQGENCVRANSPYEWSQEVNSNNTAEETITFELNSQVPTTSSRLDTPLLLTIPVSYCGLSGSMDFYVQYKDQNPIELFNVSFENLPWNTEYEEASGQMSLDIKDFMTQTTYLYLPTFKYDSETGVLLYTAGDTTWKLLHLSLVNDSGEYLVKTMNIQKYKLKGSMSDYHFYLKLKGLKSSTEPILQIYERTNVI